MSLRSMLISWLGALVFLVGVFVGLSLSAAYFWGEIEARIYSSFSGDQGMRLECPLMISPDEIGTIKAEIINRTDSEVKPVVIAEISHVGGARRTSQTFVLFPSGTQAAQWEVDSSDVIFERLILVNIFQSQYRDNPSRTGSCGILMFGLLGLTGRQTFGLIISGVITSILFGSGLWFYFRRPLDKTAVNAAQANALLAGMTITALFSTLPRWWGFTLLLDAFSLLIVGVIFVEFILFPQKDK